MIQVRKAVTGSTWRTKIIPIRRYGYGYIRTNIKRIRSTEKITI